MLCEQCKYILKPKYNLNGPPINYNRKFTDLQAGSASCQFCANLLEPTGNEGEYRRFGYMGVMVSIPSLTHSRLLQNA